MSENSNKAPLLDSHSAGVQYSEEANLFAQNSTQQHSQSPQYTLPSTSPRRHHAPTPPSTRSRLKYASIPIIAILLVTVFILAGVIFRQSNDDAQDSVQPVYAIYNATIYASSFEHRSPPQPPSSTSSQTYSNDPTHTGDIRTQNDRAYANFKPLKSGLYPFEYQTAMVIGSNGRIMDLGYDGDILQNEKYSDIPKINLNQNIISPGFTDAHGHFLNLGLGYLEPDVRDSKTPSEMVQTLLSFCKEYNIDPMQVGENWLLGGRWDESQWSEDPDMDYYLNPDGSHPFPHHAMLDKAFPKLGVALKRVDGHGCFVNKVVLDVLNLPAIDPPGGQIIRDKDGNPTGTLIDAACELVWARQETHPSSNLLLLAFSKAMKELSALGLTSVHDASIVDAELFTAQALRQRTEQDDGLYDPFPLRIHGMIDAEAVCSPYKYQCPEPYPFSLVDAGHNAPRFKNGTNWVSPGEPFEYLKNPNRATISQVFRPIQAQNGRWDGMATKLMVDGALGSWGAFLLQDYHDKPGHRGISMYTDDKINTIVTTMAKQGFQICTHCIGDAAVAQVLNAYKHASEHLHDDDKDMGERERKVKGRNDFIRGRHRVEHFQTLPPNWREVVTDLSIIPSMQPIHAVQDRTFAESRLGKERLDDEAYLWHDIETELDFLPMGTDFPVSNPSVIANLYAAVTMQEIGHDLPPFLPKNILTISDALMGLTYDAAVAQHRELDLGSIAVGKIADFVILQQDLLGLTLTPEEQKQRNIGEVVENTTVLATFVDGNAVFEHKAVNVVKGGDSDSTNIFNFTFNDAKLTQKSSIHGTSASDIAFRNTVEFGVSGAGISAQKSKLGASGDEKQHWYAARQAQSGSNQQVNSLEFILNLNQIKDQTAKHVQTTKSRLERKLNLLRSADQGNESRNQSTLTAYSLQLERLSQLELAIIDRPALFAPFDTTNTTVDQNELTLWSELRYLADSTRIAALHAVLVDKTEFQFHHSFKSVSDTPYKKVTSHYHQHDANPNHYRAHIVYPVESSDKNKNGQIDLIRPRVAPCIEHAGTWEANRRRYYKINNLNPIVVSPYDYRVSPDRKDMVTTAEGTPFGLDVIN